MKAKIELNGKVYEAELSEIEEVKSKGWKPKDGEPYFYVSDNENIFTEKYSYYSVDVNRYKRYNCFKTKEEAEAELERIKTLAEIRNRIEELNDGWQPDWKSRDFKFIIFKDNGILTCKCIRSEQMLEDWKYMKSPEIAALVLQEFGEKLNVLFT